MQRLETKNLILRRMEDRDINDLFEMRKDPRMIEFTDSKIDASLDETKEYVDKMNKGIDDNQWVIWAIELKKSNQVIGLISIWNLNKEERSGELGYGIIPDYQGRGLMKEALLYVADYGFHKMNLEDLYAYTEVNNIKSIKLLEKCNFREVDRIKEEGYYIKKTYEMVIYKLHQLEQNL